MVPFIFECSSGGNSTAKVSNQKVANGKKRKRKKSVFFLLILLSDELAQYFLNPSGWFLQETPASLNVSSALAHHSVTSN